MKKTALALIAVAALVAPPAVAVADVVLTDNANPSSGGVLMGQPTPVDKVVYQNYLHQTKTHGVWVTCGGNRNQDVKGPREWAMTRTQCKLWEATGHDKWEE